MKCLLPVLLLLSACASLPETPIAKVDDAAYAQEHPYYAELCALSEIQKKPGFGAEIESGGPGGHSVLYLNGVCRDREAHYPVITMCDPGHGVGIGSNEHYSNAAWTAVDGRDMLLGPDLPNGLTRDEYSALRQQAQATGIYDGVMFHDAAYAGILPGVTREEWKYEVSIGTDYAIGIARSRYCGKVPLSQPQMSKVVKQLNAINAPYREDKASFTWNVFYANCSHLTHSGLAAACEWDEWPINQSLLDAATNMPVPKNEFVDLMHRGNDLPIDDPVALYRDQAARRDLMQNGRLPVEPGVLASYKPVARPNEVYNTGLRLIFYDDPITGDYQPRFDAILAEPRYTDPATNRAWFAAKYRKAEESRKPLVDLLEELTPEERKGFPAFYERYAAYIAEQHKIYE